MSREPRFDERFFGGVVTTGVYCRTVCQFVSQAGKYSLVRLRAGVRRVSLGCGPFHAVLAPTRRITTETLNEGMYAAMTTAMLSLSEANGLFIK